MEVNEQNSDCTPNYASSAEGCHNSITVDDTKEADNPVLETENNKMDAVSEKEVDDPVTEADPVTKTENSKMNADNHKLVDAVSEKKRVNNVTASVCERSEIVTITGNKESMNGILEKDNDDIHNGVDVETTEIIDHDLVESNIEKEQVNDFGDPESDNNEVAKSTENNENVDVLQNENNVTVSNLIEVECVLSKTGEAKEKASSVDEVRSEEMEVISQMTGKSMNSEENEDAIVSNSERYVVGPPNNYNHATIVNSNAISLTSNIETSNATSASDPLNSVLTDEPNSVSQAPKKKKNPDNQCNSEQAAQSEQSFEDDIIMIDTNIRKEYVEITVSDGSSDEENDGDRSKSSWTSESEGDSGSSEDESSSDSSTSSTSSDEDTSDSSGKTNKEISDKMAIINESEKKRQQKSKAKAPPVLRHELGLDDLPKIESLQISVPEEEAQTIGIIMNIVDQIVIVEADGSLNPIDLGSILFLEKGKKALGEVFDVMGKVGNPWYCVRFNSKEHIVEEGIKVGATVYFAPRTEHTTFLDMTSLMSARGTDASWDNDRHVPDDSQAFSDDEEERQFRRQNAKNKQNNAGTSEEQPWNNPCGRGRGLDHQQNEYTHQYHKKMRTNEANYFSEPPSAQRQRHCRNNVNFSSQPETHWSGPAWQSRGGSNALVNGGGSRGSLDEGPVGFAGNRFGNLRGADHFGRGYFGDNRGPGSFGNNGERGVFSDNRAPGGFRDNRGPGGFLDNRDTDGFGCNRDSGRSDGNGMNDLRSNNRGTGVFCARPSPPPSHFGFSVPPPLFPMNIRPPCTPPSTISIPPPSTSHKFSLPPPSPSCSRVPWDTRPFLPTTNHGPKLQLFPQCAPKALSTQPPPSNHTVPPLQNGNSTLPRSNDYPLPPPPSNHTVPPLQNGNSTLPRSNDYPLQPPPPGSERSLWPTISTPSNNPWTLPPPPQPHLNNTLATQILIPPGTAPAFQPLENSFNSTRVPQFSHPPPMNVPPPSQSFTGFRTTEFQ